MVIRDSQKTHAIEHAARGAAAVNDIFEGRFAALSASLHEAGEGIAWKTRHLDRDEDHEQMIGRRHEHHACLLYTSDAADERTSVDLGGRRIIKKKKITVQQNEIVLLYAATTNDRGNDDTHATTVGFTQGNE